MKKNLKVNLVIKGTKHEIDFIINFMTMLKFIYPTATNKEMPDEITFIYYPKRNKVKWVDKDNKNTKSSIPFTLIMKKEKCKHQRILHIGNQSNKTDYWKCIDCGEKINRYG